MSKYDFADYDDDQLIALADTTMNDVERTDMLKIVKELSWRFRMLKKAVVK